MLEPRHHERARSGAEASHLLIAACLLLPRPSLADAPEPQDPESSPTTPDTAVVLGPVAVSGVKSLKLPPVNCVAVLLFGLTLRRLRASFSTVQR